MVGLSGLNDWEVVANLLVLIVCLVVCVQAWLIYRLTRARWTWLVLASFLWFGLIRVGIVFRLPVLDEHSRPLGIFGYVLASGSLFYLDRSLRKIYRKVLQQERAEQCEEDIFSVQKMWPNVKKMWPNVKKMWLNVRRML